ncbi:MAG: hypothetical protein ACXW06_03675, partial [Halobacteriota archaeon]
LRHQIKFSVPRICAPSNKASPLTVAPSNRTSPLCVPLQNERPLLSALLQTRRSFRSSSFQNARVLKDSVILSLDADVRCVDVIDVSALKIEIAGVYLFFGLEQLFIPYARELWVISFGGVEMKYTPREVAAHCL